MMPRPLPPALALLASLAACVPAAPETTAPQDYATHCAACHGAAGRGDGPAAAGLGRPPADLTRIAARNGGVFPWTWVMSTIDGFTRTAHGGGGPMPEFGALLLDGPTAAYDDGSGRPGPVPARLLALASYLDALQTGE
jgi:mono/diheme cytochrome c family protein